MVATSALVLVTTVVSAGGVKAVQVPNASEPDFSLRPLFHTPVGRTTGYAGDPNGMMYYIPLKSNTRPTPVRC